MPGVPTVSVVICTLNEAPNLPHVLPRIPEGIEEILLVDGRSADGTVDVARKLRPEVRVLYEDGKGKGLALRRGIEAATGDIVVTLDADGETDPADLPLFVDALRNGCDFAKGSRFAAGSKNPRGRPPWDWLMVTTFNRLFRANFTDLCSGYNGFWRAITQRIDLWSPTGWNYEPLFVIRAVKAGLRVQEVPHRSLPRLSGRSKLGVWRQTFITMRILAGERFG